MTVTNMDISSRINESNVKCPSPYNTINHFILLDASRVPDTQDSSGQIWTRMSLLDTGQDVTSFTSCNNYFYFLNIYYSFTVRYRHIMRSPQVMTYYHFSSFKERERNVRNVVVDQFQTGQVDIKLIKSWGNYYNFLLLVPFHCQWSFKLNVNFKIN